MAKRRSPSTPPRQKITRYAAAKIKRDGPDFIALGWACRLTSVRHLADSFKIRESDAYMLLAELHVPLYQPPSSPTAYFNLPTLEARLYYLLRPTIPHAYRKTPTGKWIDRHPLPGCLDDPEFREEWEAVASLYHSLTQKHCAQRLHALHKKLRTALEKGHDPEWSHPNRYHLFHRRKERIRPARRVAPRHQVPTPERRDRLVRRQGGSDSD